MRDFPSGTVTFLFTDVEGSTRRWEQDSPAMLAAIERHFALLDEAVQAHHGVRFKTIGDAVQAAFPTALDGLLAAVAAQRALMAEDWGGLGPISVRMALHTGSATPRDGDYLAPSLNRLARLIATGYGGQILMTEATRHLVRDVLPADIQLRDLGTHRLRDLREAEPVYQVNASGLAVDFPPLKSLDRPITNLPAQLTPFIGRERAIAEAKRQLAAPGVRLLTLTGPGGTGKTRLSLRVAADVLEMYPDGVWFVALAPVSSARLVAPTIAETLGVREAPGEPVLETLRGYLRSKNLLLVLDNFEHVIEAAPLVAELLAGSPGLRVLATSRAPLRISGEHELPVPPLGLPDARDGMRLDEVLAAEAVRLFVDRAQAVRPDFTLNERNAATVATICQRLDGLPLAIELAAARVRLLSPEAILARLDSRLTLLTGGSRDLPERQQTLRAAIGWSHDLLAPDEQTLFRRLAVFVGGWTLDAAEATVNAVDGPDISVIDSLAALLDNSLIRQIEADDADVSGEPRFMMLQTIREFAAERLQASGELETLRQGHAEYFLALAVEAGPHLTGPESAPWLQRLETDHDNVRTALDWLRQRGEAERAVELAGALWRFWWLRGHLSEGRQELEATLVADEKSPSPARAAALDGAGVLAETQGDYARAQELHEEALAMSRELGDTASVARSLGNLGVVAFDRGDGDLAASLLEESLVLAREADDSLIIASSLLDLGNVAYGQGDLERAETLYRESLAVRRRHGNGSEIARSLNNLGNIAIDQGAFARAHGIFEEALSLYRAAGDKWGAAGALNGLADAIRGEGDLASACALLEESLALFDEMGDTRNAGVTLINLADTAWESGDREHAAKHYREALARLESVDEPLGIFNRLADLGGLLMQSGRCEAAARLFGVAASLGDETSARSRPDATQFEAQMAAARAEMGEEAFQAAWEAGRSLILGHPVPAASGAGTG